MRVPGFDITPSLQNREAVATGPGTQSSPTALGLAWYLTQAVGTTAYPGRSLPLAVL